MGFQNKVVIVTGGSSGIGAATAKLFAKEGANVVIAGRNQERLTHVAQEITKIGKPPLTVNADVSKDSEAARIISETIKRFGRIDVLVNNAGFSKPGTILDGTILEGYDAMMSTNLRAVVNLTALAAPHLVKTKGNIVNVSSVAGLKNMPIPGFLGYEVSKAGLRHFTSGAALELATKGVRVNSVSPGPVRTDFAEHSDLPVTLDAIGQTTPLKRASNPDEIGHLILYLASEKAVGITGSDFVTDNGALLHLSPM